METEMLEQRFGVIGARIKLIAAPRGSLRINVSSDRCGEFFEIRFLGQEPVDLEVVDVRPDQRHLLLRVRDGDEKSTPGAASQRGHGLFLCGHDERHWFVAAVPESTHCVTGVMTAKAALRPNQVWNAIDRASPKHADRGRNAAYVRQARSRRARYSTSL